MLKCCDIIERFSNTSYFFRTFESVGLSFLHIVIGLSRHEINFLDLNYKRYDTNNEIFFWNVMKNTDAQNVLELQLIN